MLTPWQKPVITCCINRERDPVTVGDRHAERNGGACILPGRERVAGRTIRIDIRWEDDIAVVRHFPLGLKKDIHRQ